MREIIFNEEVLPLHFGLRAIKEFASTNNFDFDSVMTGNKSIEGINLIVSLTVFGLNLGARKAGNDKRFDEDFVWDMYEEAPEIIYQVMEIFQESMQVITSKLGALAPKKATPTAPSESQ